MEPVQHPAVTGPVTWVDNGRHITRMWYLLLVLFEWLMYNNIVDLDWTVQCQLFPAKKAKSPNINLLSCLF